MLIDKPTQAFLDVIAFSEGVYGVSDDGYNVLCGSLPGHPKLFDGYADHPRIMVKLSEDLKSTAAGRYQIKALIFDSYKGPLALHDFGHEAQDAIANRMIRECGADLLIKTGRIAQAITACKSRWASFPGAGYGQRETSMESLLNFYSGRINVLL